MAMEPAARALPIVSMADAIADWREGLLNYKIWLHLALSDVRLKYRRTAIGPFWITLSTGLLIVAISLVFSGLLGRTFSEFVPYGAAGIISWYYIASGMSEGCVAIVSNSNIYKNLPAPFSFTVLRLLVRNLIVFAHNFLIFVAIAVILQINFLPSLPKFLVSLALVTINLAWIIMVLSVLTTRYRDIQQMVGSSISILFLVTPIFWEKKALSATWIYRLNPFTYFIDALRVPLVGGDGWATACFMLVVFAIVGWVVALSILGYCRKRIAFWL